MLDGVGSARGSIAADEDSADLRVSLGSFELSGHPGEEAVEDQLRFDADDGVVRAGHADVGNVGGSSGQHAGVGGGDVGVGSEDGGDAPVEIPAEGALLAGGLGVDVEQDDLRGQLADQLVGLAEGVVAGGHEDASLKVEDGVLLARGKLALVDAEAWCADGIVGGAKDAAAALVRVGGDGHVLEDLALVPDVVSGGDDMSAEIEDLFGERRGNAEAARGVFAIDDKKVDGMSFEQVREVLAYDVAAGRAEDVADEEDIHSKILHAAIREERHTCNGCVSLLGMAQSERFQLSLRVLSVLAEEPGGMKTSAEIAEALKESAVMVRRAFLLLHKAGLIEQRKGPRGGARLKVSPKQIGLGDVFAATVGDWLVIEDKAVAGLMKKVREDAVEAMNEHSLAQVVKRMKKGK